jgi:hypothetical protein
MGSEANLRGCNSSQIIIAEVSQFGKKPVNCHQPSGRPTSIICKAAVV